MMDAKKNTSGQLYDKTGAAFSLDHVIDGTAYVRPMVKVFTQYGYGDDVHEEEDVEPAKYLVAVERSSLFEVPPVVALDADIVAKTAEIAALKAEAKKVIAELKSKRSAAEYELASAKRQLDEWMQTHKGVIDLGKLLDGKILYPLSVEENDSSEVIYPTSRHPTHWRPLPAPPRSPRTVSTSEEQGEGSANVSKGISE